MKVIENIFYDNDQCKTLNIYLPDCTEFPVVIYFHGGGLENGDKSNASCLAKYLTGKGVAVVSANYRMYPTAKYPDYICDAAQAVNWTLKNIGGYGKANKIYICGSSAGAYISMMLCFDKSYLAKYGIDNIDGYIHDAGQPTCHFNVLRERGIDKRRVIVDEAAPLFHIEADNNYPHMLFIVSDNDMENRYEQTMLILSTLKHLEYNNITSVVMHGNHCQYVSELDSNNESVFGKIIYDYLKIISEEV